MTRASYPRIGHGPGGKPPKGTAYACACTKPATRALWVEFSYMRGEDERYWVCDACHSRATKGLRGWLRSLPAETKLATR